METKHSIWRLQDVDKSSRPHPAVVLDKKTVDPSGFEYTVAAMSGSGLPRELYPHVDELSKYVPPALNVGTNPNINIGKPSTIKGTSIRHLWRTKADGKTYRLADDKLTRLNEAINSPSK